MRCASALSSHPVAAHAVGDALADLLGEGCSSPTLVIVFTTPSLAGACEDILGAVRSTLDPRATISITSSGVIGAGSEIVGGSCVALWAMWNEHDRSDPNASIVILDEGLDALGPDELLALEDASSLIIIGDPGAPDVSRILASLGPSTAARSVIGALLSSAAGPARLTTEDGAVHGLVAIALTVTMHSVIGSGTSPISETMSITKSIGNMVCEIDDRPALAVTQEVLACIDTDDRAHIARELAVGRHDTATDELLEVVQVLGADRTTGSLALSDEISETATIRFHRQDRERPLQELSRPDDLRASGALVFSCMALDPRSDRDGVGVVDSLADVLGTSRIAGVHVSAVIGTGPDGTALRAAPISAAIFGRHHH